MPRKQEPYKFDWIGKVPTLGNGNPGPMKPGRCKRREFEQLIAPTLQWMRHQYVIAGRVPRKVRSWCYTFEQAGLIGKDDFGALQRQLVNWRLWGFIPLDWMSEDEDRAIHRSDQHWVHNGETLDGVIRDHLAYIRQFNAPYFQPHSPWEDQDCFVMLGCEKSDVASLLIQGLPEYIPHFALGGQPDLHSRAKLLGLCAEAVDLGMQPVILYVGDHDIGGFNIAGGSMGDFEIDEKVGYMSNLAKLENAADAVGMADEIEFVRIGIDLDWCTDNGIPIIQNAITSGGKDLADEDHSLNKSEAGQAYLAQFGSVKAECNALFAAPEAARSWIGDRLWEYLDQDAHTEYVQLNKAAQQKARDAWEQVRAQLGGAIDSILEGLD
jgi:hypothetical protein